MCSVVCKKSFLQPFGEDALVNEVKNGDATDDGQHQGEVLGSSPLMNSIVDLECLLPLRDFKVAGVHLTPSCRGGDLSGRVNQGTGQNRPL